MNIYLDTNCWNDLCDQNVDSQNFQKRLASRGVSLVLGVHILYEVSKSSDETRRKRLFTYLREFVEPPSLCVLDNMHILHTEAEALAGRPFVIDPFLPKVSRTSLVRELESLSNGEHSNEANVFIGERINFASKTRFGQAQHLQNRADIKDKLMAISPEALEPWLRKESMGLTGAALLAGHLERLFPGISEKAAIERALGLLAPPAKRFARGVVRADLYYNWRRATRGSNPKDLIDDIYHVLNAVYCDIYATGNIKQEEYARLLLTSNTKVVVRPNSVPVEQWIEKFI
jgi:hypothetical protein